MPKGWRTSAEAGIHFNMIAVVPPSALDYPDELFDFMYRYREHLTDFHFNFMDAPVTSISDFTASEADRRTVPAVFESAPTTLCRIRTAAAGRFEIRNLTHMYKKMFGSPEDQEQLSARSMSRPFKTLNVEVNGNVTTFYAGLTSQEYKDLYSDGIGLVVGNALKQSLDEIANSPKLQRIANDFEIEPSRLRERMRLFRHVFRRIQSDEIRPLRNFRC